MNTSLSTPAVAGTGISPLPWATRFRTLLQREWFQHRLGWIIVTALPLLVAALILIVGRIQLEVNDEDLTVHLGQVPALVLAAATIVSTALLAFVLAWMSTLFQVPGLARRDQQDRSIEFWLSLPVGHGSSLAAPLLAHLLLFPLAALGIGLLTGHVLSLVVVTRFASFGDWLALPWLQVLAIGLAVTLRTALGLLLATLWLLPLILLVMVASAWLKRWGVPALVVGAVLLGNVFKWVLGTSLVWNFGQALLQRAGRSFLHGGEGGSMVLRQGQDPLPVLQALPAWALRDGGNALRALADPLLLLVLALSAGLFMLLVLRRQRGG